MTNLRLEDAPGNADFERSSRFFYDSNDGLWYFRTREGKDIGPFRYQNEAEAMLQQFVLGLIQASKPVPGTHKLHFRLSSKYQPSSNTSHGSW
ncbi:MAG: DUF6316 family protein [Pseudomonadales bacterium]|nr:DUF6316 family protein [Pseudomonadales bacterium]